jgi:hypothetical protein
MKPKRQLCDRPCFVIRSTIVFRCDHRLGGTVARSAVENAWRLIDRMLEFGVSVAIGLCFAKWLIVEDRNVVFGLMVLWRGMGKDNLSHVGTIVKAFRGLARVFLYVFLRSGQTFHAERAACRLKCLSFVLSLGDKRLARIEFRMTTF